MLASLSASIGCITAMYKQTVSFVKIRVIILLSQLLELLWHLLNQDITNIYRMWEFILLLYSHLILIDLQSSR